MDFQTPLGIFTAQKNVLNVIIHKINASQF